MSKPKADPAFDLDIWEGADSPTVTLIKQFHKSYGLKTWSNDKVGKLCRKLRCTLYELCSLAGFYSKVKTRHLWEKSRRTGEPWPPELALHFAKLDAYANERLFRSPQPPDVGDVVSAIIVARALTDA